MEDVFMELSVVFVECFSQIHQMKAGYLSF